MSEETPVVSGLGSFLADALPFAPSGARRAGAAEIMAQRMPELDDRNVSPLVRYPMASQLAAAIGGLGWATQSRSVPEALLKAFGPLALVQLARGAEIRGIQKKYEGLRKRRRLSQISKLDELVGRNPSALDYLYGGSSRLGAASAYQMMRDRKRKDLPAYSEATDVLPLASAIGVFQGALPTPMMAAHLPFTSALDQMAVKGVLSEKKAADEDLEDVPPSASEKRRTPHTDQRLSPVIPYYVAAALLGHQANQLAGKNLSRELSTTSSRALERDKWDDLVYKVTPDRPAVAAFPSLGNAFYASGPSIASDPLHTRFATDLVLSDPDNYRWYDWFNLFRKTRDVRSQLKSEGLIAVDPEGLNRAPIIAHEGGHSRIESQPGMLRFLQRHLYPKSELLAPLAGAGGFAAGMAAGGPLRGALAGMLTGGLVQAGKIAPEFMATRYGMSGLRNFEGGKYLSSGDNRLMNSALATYLATTLAVPTLAGAAGGWIRSRRKKLEKQKSEQFT